MKRIILTAVVLLISMGVCINGTGVAGDSCEKSACRSGDKYDTRQQRCESESWSYRSHYQPSCPAGYDLDRTKGICVKQGECCEKSACKKGYRWDAHDQRCEAGPTFPFGYRSHYTPKCEAGWDLNAETGLCEKRGCGLTVPPQRGELFRNKPDLVVQSFGLLSWGSCRPGQTVFTFQVTVTNSGAAASPRVLLRVRDQHDVNWAAGVMVGALAPGHSQTVTMAIRYLGVPENHMTLKAPHPFKAVIDPGSQVHEADEENNESAVINVGAPRGCR